MGENVKKGKGWGGRTLNWKAGLLLLFTHPGMLAQQKITFAVIPLRLLLIFLCLQLNPSTAESG